MATKTVNIKHSKYDVYIGRAGKGQGGYFGNPVELGKKCPVCGKIHTYSGSTIECYRKYFFKRIETDEDFRNRVLALKDKTLGCFCKPNLCHGDVIAKWLDEEKMKEYPSIPQAVWKSFREIPNALIFDKLDGSSLRSEWNPKQGWYKHGKRHGLLDDSNSSLTAAPKLFEQSLAEPLAKIARDSRWQSLVVFYEFWGVQSLGGQHVENDPKFLTLFDAAVNKKGILGPAEFRRVFEGKVETAKCIDSANWTRGYMDRVRNNDIEGITLEGVVAKAGTGHNIVRAKAKTQIWIDRILAVHGEIQGKKITES